MRRNKKKTILSIVLAVFLVGALIATSIFIADPNRSFDIRNYAKSNKKTELTPDQRSKQRAKDLQKTKPVKPTLNPQNSYSNNLNSINGQIELKKCVAGLPSSATCGQLKVGDWTGNPPVKATEQLIKYYHDKALQDLKKLEEQKKALELLVPPAQPVQLNNGTTTPGPQ